MVADLECAAVHFLTSLLSNCTYWARDQIAFVVTCIIFFAPDWISHVLRCGCRASCVLNRFIYLMEPCILSGVSAVCFTELPSAGFLL